MKISRLAIVGVSIGLFLLGGAAVRAIAVDISGNAANTDNSVNLQVDGNATVQQLNRGGVDNRVDAKANSVGGGKTGGAVTKVVIDNQLNTNRANVGGCCPEDNGGPPSPPPPPPPPGPPGFPGGPLPPPRGNGGVGDGGVGVRGDGPGEEVTEEEQAVLGLAAASGDSSGRLAFYLLGLLCLGLGAKKLGWGTKRG